MKKSLAFLALCVSLSGCASSSVPFAYRTEGFTQQETAIIVDAANEWNTKSNGEFNALIDPGCSENTCSIIRKVNQIITPVYVEGVNVKNTPNTDAWGECTATCDYGAGPCVLFMRMGVRAQRHNVILRADPGCRD